MTAPTRSQEHLRRELRAAIDAAIARRLPLEDVLAILTNFWCGAMQSFVCPDCLPEITEQKLDEMRAAVLGSVPDTTRTLQ